MISSKFSTHRVSRQTTLFNFQKKFPLLKNGCHFDFSNFCQKWKNTNLLPQNSGHFEFWPKMQKHKFASISLTVQDRVISSKFSTHRVSQQTTLCNFQTNFLSLKMVVILKFTILLKMQKHKFPSISLTVRDRAISSKFHNEFFIFKYFQGTICYHLRIFNLRIFNE